VTVVDNQLCLRQFRRPDRAPVAQCLFQAAVKRIAVFDVRQITHEGFLTQPEALRKRRDARSGGLPLFLRHPALSLRSTEDDMSNFDKTRLKRIDDWMDGYVEEGKFPGATMLLAQGGEIVHRATTGWMDVEAQKPFREDTIVRIFSMTKPITSVALMMLAEKGDFHMDAPLSDFIPEFADMEALIPGATSIDQTERCATPTLAQAATHTSGLSYSFNPTPLSEKYADLRQDFGPASGTLEGMAAQAGSLPLAFKPGTEWHYSVGIDILGRVIEVVSGKTLDVFFKEEIFDPLDMDETFFTIPDDKLDSFALYDRKLTEEERQSLFAAQK